MTQPDWLLALNTGSTSIKFAAFARSDLRPLLSGALRQFPDEPQWRIDLGPPAPQGAPRALSNAIHAILTYVKDALGAAPVAIGHRIVHGGGHTLPMRFDTDALAQLRSLSAFAPLHQAMGVDAAEIAMTAWPGVPNLAVFDTAFHHTMPDAEKTLPLPREDGAKGIMRYGFHGLSFQSAANRLRARFGKGAGGRVVAAHLGGGASLCAMLHGESRATTMGLTPAGGVPMATRSGDLDPGVVLALVREHGVEGAEHRLNREAGMRGISGRTGDVMTLLQSHAAQDRLALDIYVRRIQQAIAAMAMAIGGMDALVFTGGAGTHAPELRRRIAEGCAWLGVDLDHTANTANAEIISTATSRIMALQVAAQEELMIAQAILAVI
ncbi:MAG TPA: hypothetical protein PLA85_03140 [Micropepsaceae bacterium]|nr:hypothetical protein [Micropepsaceae bacterium]